MLRLCRSRCSCFASHDHDDAERTSDDSTSTERTGPHRHRATRHVCALRRHASTQRTATSVSGSPTSSCAQASRFDAFTSSVPREVNLATQCRGLSAQRCDGISPRPGYAARCRRTLRLAPATPTFPKSASQRMSRTAAASSGSSNVAARGGDRGCQRGERHAGFSLRRAQDRADLVTSGTDARKPFTLGGKCRAQRSDQIWRRAQDVRSPWWRSRCRSRRRQAPGTRSRPGPGARSVQWQSRIAPTGFPAAR